MKQLLCLFVALLLASQAFGQTVTEAELDLLRDMLSRAGQRPGDVNFLKDWSDDTQLKLPVVIDILNNPLHYPAFVDEMAASIELGQNAQTLERYASVLGWSDSLDIIGSDRFDTFFRANVQTSQDIFPFVEWVLTAVEAEWDIAWENLEAAQRDTLQSLALTLWQEEEDSLAYLAVLRERGLPELDEMDSEDMLRLVKLVRFDHLAQAANILQGGFTALQNNIGDIPWGQRIDKITRWGRMVIGSDGPDTYSLPCCFILDPGGDDIYRGQLSTTLEQPFLQVLDLGGDDLYVGSAPGGTLAALCGLAMLFDGGGNDVYRGGDLTLSATLGWLDFTDMAGNDIYDAGQYSLGAASFGVCVLRDDDGRDSYSGTQFSQGFGGPLGIGILADRNGADHYFAGGQYLHEPLAPLDHRSLSQGFGFGLRPDIAGGVGMLWDGGGNDSYQGGVYAQGVAYWYALGILYDRAGNDFYNAVYYPQGSGIHLAAGFLFDGAGEDSYYSKHGPGQGAAHDYGVGWLVDRQGDDAYSVEGGGGLALTNSVAIFLDVQGNDRYERAQRDNYGFGRQARETGSLGLFLDTGGQDIYPRMDDVPRKSSAGENRFWTHGTYGIGFDTLMVETTEVMNELAEEEAADIDPEAPIAEIFAIASEWGVGSAVKRVETAAAILLERDTETAAYIFYEELGAKSGLTFRAITNYAKESEVMADFIQPALVHEDSLWQKNAIALIGEMEAEDYLDQLAEFAASGQYKTAALSALGKLKTDRATSVLERYRSDPSEKVRVIVARGLKHIDTARSREKLAGMSNDSSFLVRTMVRLAGEHED
ncbi:MAG: hypothetical protein K8R90_01065 [Candidatus Cloacimonetes bacterium]|nr:hypothetical protein [Candidatus Cloacimonadota bacterium]